MSVVVAAALLFAAVVLVIRVGERQSRHDRHRPRCCRRAGAVRCRRDLARITADHPPSPSHHRAPDRHRVGATRAARRPPRGRHLDRRRRPRPRYQHQGRRAHRPEHVGAWPERRCASSSTSATARTSTPGSPKAAGAPRSMARRCASSISTVSVTVVEATYDQPRGSTDGAIVRLVDITDREGRGRALEQARRRFQQAFHSAPDGHGPGASRQLDDHRRQSLARRDAPAPRDDLVGRSIREITHPDDLKAAAVHRARLELGIADTYLLDQRYERSDGTFVWARTRVAVTEDDGVPLAITHIEDVTEQKRVADQLRWAATHDDLTGLPNRTELLSQVDELLAGRSRRLGGVAVHRSRQLQGGQRQPRPRHRRPAAHGDVGADPRRGRRGDVARPIRRRRVHRRAAGRARTPPFDPAAVAEVLRATIREAVDVEGTEFFITASIGFSVNAEATSAADLLRDADGAMYRAKSRGRDCVEAYAPGLQETTALALRTATELRRGIDRGEIVPYYQPIVELTTGHVVGFEALARWLHPERGLLGPEQFLPLAEETGSGRAHRRGDPARRTGPARSLAGSRPALRRRLSGRQRRYPPGRRRLVRQPRRRPARRDRHPRRLGVVGDHRDGPARRRQGLDGGDAQAPRPRPASRRRRLRHRLLVAHLPQALSRSRRSRSTAASSPGSVSTARTRRSSRPSSTSGTRSAWRSSPRAWRRRCSSPGCARSAATGARATCSAARAPRASSRASARPPDRAPTSGEDPCHSSIRGRSVSTSATILPQMGETGRATNLACGP